MTGRSSRSPALWLLLAALLFQGVSGVAGGIGLVGDPSGGALHLPASLLEGTPFGDYRIPGLVLLVVLGIFPLVVVARLWREKSWAWFGALLTGAALVVWIAVQVMMIGYASEPPLQLIYGVLGIAILVLALRPEVRARFRA
jgi:uncharacterized BrkB/YihY/UPF0761 family membrane protein